MSCMNPGIALYHQDIIIQPVLRVMQRLGVVLEKASSMLVYKSLLFIVCFPLNNMSVYAFILYIGHQIFTLLLE